MLQLGGQPPKPSEPEPRLVENLRQLSVQVDLNAPVLLAGVMGAHSGLSVPLVRFQRLHLHLTPPPPTPALEEEAAEASFGLWVHAGVSAFWAEQEALLGSLQLSSVSPEEPIPSAPSHLRLTSPSLVVLEPCDFSLALALPASALRLVIAAGAPGGERISLPEISIEGALPPLGLSLWPELLQESLRLATCAGAAIAEMEAEAAPSRAAAALPTTGGAVVHAGEPSRQLLPRLRARLQLPQLRVLLHSPMQPPNASASPRDLPSELELARLIEVRCDALEVVLRTGDAGAQLSASLRLLELVDARLGLPEEHSEVLAIESDAREPLEQGLRLAMADGAADGAVGSASRTAAAESESAAESPALLTGSLVLSAESSGARRGDSSSSDSSAPVKRSGCGTGLPRSTATTINTGVLSA